MEPLGRTMAAILDASLVPITLEIVTAYISFFNNYVTASPANFYKHLAHFFFFFF